MSQIDYRLTRHHRDCDVSFTQCEHAVDRGDWKAAERAFTVFVTIWKPTSKRRKPYFSRASRAEWANSNEETTMSRVHTVDGRGLEPPEPFTLALDALADLAQGDELRVLLDRVPHPLLRLLERDGHPYDYFIADDGSVEVRIGAVPTE